MAWSRKKKAFAALCGVLAVLAVILIATPARKDPEVRMTFVRTTNTAQGLMCVFRVVNGRTDSMTTRGGFYQLGNITNFAAQAGHLPAAFLVPLVSIPARSTNLLEVMMPTNRGSYTLIVPWRPAMSPSPLHQLNLVAAAKIWYARKTKAPPEKLYQRLGWVYVASDMFDVSSSPPRQRGLTSKGM